jgi:type IV pilus assembly protein PilY1
MEFTDDGSMYGLDYYCNRMVKITGPTGMTPHKQYPQSEGGGVGYHGIWTVEATFGSRGSGNNQWDYSYGIGSRGNDLYVADSDNQRVLKYNASTNFATYDTKIGTSFTSMDMAKRVIKAIMRDSSITDGANFGLMEWSCNYKVRVNVSDTGAQEILADIDNITTGGGTCLGKAMQHAENYFKGSNSPIDPNVSCENTYIIVISDGVWVQNPNPDTVAARLLNGRDNIKTYAVGFLNYGNKSNYQSLAIAGGTKTPLYADDEDALLQKLKDTLTQVVASNQTYTAPMITSDLSKGDFIYQSLFNYKTSSQWEGHLNKYNLKADGSIGSLVWDAGAQLNSNSASSRQIWTVGDSYPSGLNNFTASNLNYLKSELYYRVTEGSDTDATKLINYVRGVDAYDEDKDGNATEGRWKLGDIYHSELALISAPNATDESSNTFTEAHYRQNNNYSGFKNANSSRSSIILAGANDGMLHAFNASSGKELWAFIPPSLIQKLRTVVSSKANSTNPIFGVDGSPVVKDIYYDSKWRTVALTGLGKGGNSYFALDVTDVNQPAHLFTIMNDPNFNEVSYWDASGDKTVYSYTSTSFSNDDYDFSKLGEAWSTPRIMRMKIDSKDKWVAVFGAGFNNAVSPEYGSAVFIIDMEDGGKVLKQIDVADKSGNSIINSVPVGIIPIIADGSPLANYHGAMAYFADYEGKLWKLNLSDQGTLYDMQQLFDAESTGANGRRVMKDVVASIDTDNTLWFYYGTGDQQQLQKVSPSIANRLYGLKDTDFPNYNSSATAFSVSQCRDVTSKSANCPTDSEKGWYIDLKDNEKTTARASVSNRTIYFSRYIPNDANPCVAGNASITSHDYRCGNVLQDISLGGGVATEAVIFKGKIYVGLSGTTNSTGSSSSGTPTSDTITLEEGWSQTGNLIVGTAPAGRGSGGGQITIESWRHVF